MFATFSGKPLFGYRSMVAATLFICLVSFMVWLHHFFTMGAGADVNAAFGIATSIIAVGTGVKIYNWVFTMYGGRVRFATPMMWALGFVVTFVIGGITGVMLAVPPADFMLHNSMFLIAHFHNVIISGVVFAIFAAITYWFPKAFGFRLHEGWGHAAFWFTLAGFVIVFGALYVTGFQGMTRRLQHVEVDEWAPWLYLSVVGVGVMVIGAFCQIMQLVVSIRRRHELVDHTGDPWDGRTLEWWTLSPPPHFNFAVLPDVHGEEAYWSIKERAFEQEELAPEPKYEPIHMPKNSPTGVVSAFFATLIGFALIWHIWWMVILGFIGAYATFVVFAWRKEDEYTVDVEELREAERQRRAARSQWFGLREPA